MRFGTPVAETPLNLSTSAYRVVAVRPVALREKHRLRVFENRVLRRIFGPKRDEVMRDWRKLHNEGLHNMYSSPSIIRVIKSKSVKWGEHVARMGKNRNTKF
jgi:hypothetical protein